MEKEEEETYRETVATGSYRTVDGCGGGGDGVDSRKESRSRTRYVKDTYFSDEEEETHA